MVVVFRDTPCTSKVPVASSMHLRHYAIRIACLAAMVWSPCAVAQVTVPPNPTMLLIVGGNSCLIGWNGFVTQQR
jgi:hypothetical protein